ncbi:MAG: cell division protein ZapA [Proteobacteria bacterium]|jgi:cell division protein ZapA|nr:cell division protein ZapA [Pseudomonadota bacterium]MDA0908567.1 cell division protein ZapA [Pseudomonadota bacterium]MDA1320158.1 cell division protein ZapA [Pseudomonadota bacterium]
MAEARVTVTINGQNYPLACQPGEEDHIRALAARLDEYSRQIAASGGSINESRLLVMVGLIMADRLHELEKGTLASVNVAESPAPAPALSDEKSDTLAASIEDLALRMEQLASQLKAH